MFWLSAAHDRQQAETIRDGHRTTATEISMRLLEARGTAGGTPLQVLQVGPRFRRPHRP